MSTPPIALIDGQFANLHIGPLQLPSVAAVVGNASGQPDGAIAVSSIDGVVMSSRSGVWSADSTVRTYDHSQPTPASTWTINHNLGFKPSVDVFDAGSREVNVEVLHTSVNQTLVLFVAPNAGFARLT